MVLLLKERNQCRVACFGATKNIRTAKKQAAPLDGLPARWPARPGLTRPLSARESGAKNRGRPPGCARFFVEAKLLPYCAGLGACNRGRQ